MAKKKTIPPSPAPTAQQVTELYDATVAEIAALQERIAQVKATFGEKLRSARTASGRSVAKAAEETGISRVVLNRLEAGTGRMPDADTFATVASMFDTTITNGNQWWQQQ